MKELGYDVEYYLWVGIWAPKGTPDNVIAYLRDAVSKAAHSEDFAKALTNLGQELDYLDQPAFTKFWAEDTQRIESAIKLIGKV
jgi:tripartite-type tricarboxylate transporter receptor subunit TctC